MVQYAQKKKKKGSDYVIRAKWKEKQKLRKRSEIQQQDAFQTSEGVQY